MASTKRSRDSKPGFSQTMPLGTSLAPKLEDDQIVPKPSGANRQPVQAVSCACSGKSSPPFRCRHTAAQSRREKSKAAAFIDLRRMRRFSSKRSEAVQLHSCKREIRQ